MTYGIYKLTVPAPAVMTLHGGMIYFANFHTFATTPEGVVADAVKALADIDNVHRLEDPFELAIPPVVEMEEYLRSATRVLTSTTLALSNGTLTCAHLFTEPESATIARGLELVEGFRFLQTVLLDYQQKVGAGSQIKALKKVLKARVSPASLGDLETARDNLDRAVVTAEHFLAVTLGYNHGTFNPHYKTCKEQRDAAHD